MIICPFCLEEVDKLTLYVGDEMCHYCAEEFEADDAMSHSEFEESLQYMDEEYDD